MRTGPTPPIDRVRRAQSLLDLARNLRTTQGPQARVFAQGDDGRVRWIVAYVPAVSAPADDQPAGGDWLESPLWRVIAFWAWLNVVLLALSVLVRIVRFLW